MKINEFTGMICRHFCPKKEKYFWCCGKCMAVRITKDMKLKEFLKESK